MPFRLDIFVPAAKPSTRPVWWARALRRIGPTWQSAPIRRIVQATCLLAFLWLFVHVAWPYSDRFSARVIAAKESLPLESFLWIDPLVGLSTAIAARAWNVALVGMAGILVVCLLIPRGFCGYLCPLGTLIDCFDWLLLRLRLRRKTNGNGTNGTRKNGGPNGAKNGSADPPPRPAAHPWWVHLKYYILAGSLIAAVFGVLITGFFAAIPVLTRGLLFSAARLQTGLQKNWSQVPAADPALWLSLALFAGVFLLSLIRPRFWCRYVCPSGALFSVFNVFRTTQRQVESSCINCNKCVLVCPFDAIKEDFTTRTLDCTLCQTCGGVCPTHSIKFVARNNTEDLKAVDNPPVAPRELSRRGVLTSIVAGAAIAVAGRAKPVTGASAAAAPLRPPGSVPEDHFLDLCIRCGECFKVCPGPVLHHAGLKDGFENLWTPVAQPTHAGCHQECNFCTQVCPTGAIVPLTIQQKKKTPMGLAIVQTKTCLPHAGKQDCKLCYDECTAAGYHAIEMRKIPLAVGDIPEGAVSDEEREQMSHILAPFVDPARCVGCGLCEYRCHTALVNQHKLLDSRAIITLAEDRTTPRRII